MLSNPRHPHRPRPARMVTGTQARQVNSQEAHDFGISTDRVCLEIEHIFFDAADDVLRHTITVDYSGQPYVTRHVPTRRDSCASSSRPVARRGRPCLSPAKPHPPPTRAGTGTGQSRQLR